MLPRWEVLCRGRRAASLALGCSLLRGERAVRAGTYLMVMAGKEEPASQPGHRSASCLQVLWRPQMVNCCLKANPSCSLRRREGLAFIPGGLRTQPQGLPSAFGPLQAGSTSAFAALARRSGACCGQAGGGDRRRSGSLAALPSSRPLL